LGSKRKNYCRFEWAFFIVGAAIYVEGHGIHLTADMLKRPVEEFITNYPNSTTEYPVLNDIFYYSETTWEHTVGHYLYAFGAIVMAWSQVWLYKSDIHPPLQSIREKVAFLAASLVYSFDIAGVAIEFPSGLIVGLIFLGLYAVPLGIYTYKTGELFSMGRRLILQFFLLAYSISLIWIIIYIGMVGGIEDRKAAGYP